MKKFFVLVLLTFIGGGSLLAYNVISSNKRAEKLAADIQSAKDALNTGDTVETVSILKPMWETNDTKELREKIGFMLFSAYQKENNSAELISLGEAFEKEFPKSPNTPMIKVAVLDAKMKSGADLDKLMPELENLADDGDLKARNMILFHEAEGLREQGDHVAARDKYTELYDYLGDGNDLTPKVEDALGEINIELLYSKQMLDGDVEYVIASGDTLGKVSKKYKVPLALLQECNGISNPRLLRIGQKLKVPKCDFEIIVDKSSNVMVVKNNGKFFKKYPVRTGRTDDLTPNGTFYIENKKKDPTWRRPGDGKAFEPGHPENELGTRWMSFWKDRLGIHGTIEPESIGKYSSSGCVGMLKADVEEMFEYIPLRTPIKIVGEKRDDIAMAY